MLGLYAIKFCNFHFDKNAQIGKTEKITKFTGQWIIEDMILLNWTLIMSCKCEMQWKRAQLDITPRDAITVDMLSFAMTMAYMRGYCNKLSWQLFNICNCNLIAGIVISLQVICALHAAMFMLEELNDAPKNMCCMMHDEHVNDDNNTRNR